MKVFGNAKLLEKQQWLQFVSKVHSSVTNIQKCINKEAPVNNFTTEIVTVAHSHGHITLCLGIHPWSIHT